MKRSPLPNRLLVSLVVAALAVAAGCGDSPTGDLEAATEAAPLSAEVKDALAILPADADFLAVTDAQAFQQNGALPGQQNLTGETGARLRDFFDATGFDPAEDVRKVYVAKPSGAPSAREAAPQVAVAADFDRARFEEQLGNGAFGDRFTQSTYNGRTLYRAEETDRGDGFSFALTSDGLILFAPHPEGIRQMIDRLDGSGRSLTDDGELMGMAERVRGRGDTWFVARGFGKEGSFVTNDGGSGRLGKIAEVLRAAAGAVSIDDRTAEGDLFLYTQGGSSPDDLKEVLEGIVSAYASRDGLGPDQRAALEDIEIRRMDDAVQVTFAFPMSSE